jgi:hypothetical protein
MVSDALPNAKYLLINVRLQGVVPRPDKCKYKLAKRIESRSNSKLVVDSQTFYFEENEKGCRKTTSRKGGAYHRVQSFKEVKISL